MSVTRPLPVRIAEGAGLAAAVLGALREALLWNQRVALDGVGLALIFTVVVPLLLAVLVLGVTRKRSKLSLGLLAVLAGIAWFATSRMGLTDGSAAFTAGAASLILHTGCVLLMLLPSALRWLRGGAHG